MHIYIHYLSCLTLCSLFFLNQKKKKVADMIPERKKRQSARRCDENRKKIIEQLLINDHDYYNDNDINLNKTINVNYLNEKEHEITTKSHLIDDYHSVSTPPLCHNGNGFECDEMDGACTDRRNSKSMEERKSKRIKTLPLAELKEKIRSKFEAPLKIVHISETIGNGVVAQCKILQGSFVCEYHGELISNSEAKRREQEYAKAQKGCYMYYFNYKSRTMCIDATDESKSQGHGRLINHNRRDANLVPKRVVVDGKPHIIYIALRDIEENEELTFDYGDRRKETLEVFPWLLQ